MDQEQLDEIEKYLNDDESRRQFFMNYIEGFIENGNRISVDNLQLIYSTICCDYFNVDTPTADDIKEAKAQLNLLKVGKYDDYITLDEFIYGASKYFIAALKMLNS